MSALISIIIPVYKTEPYLRRCLHSVVGQTYKNLEIILVDDGSPDGCGKICDLYAAADSRVKVIHQQNRGLSVARNEGLKIASGDYFGFVDSDDWIDADMYEVLYQGAIQYGADIAICGYYYVAGDRYKEIKEERTTLYDRENAIHHLLVDEKITNHVWNKLYKRKLFEDVRFPAGRTFEDIGTTYKLFEKAGRIVFLNSCHYYYLQRQDGIVSGGNIQHAVDRCLMLHARYEDLIQRYPDERDCLLTGFNMAFADLGDVASRAREKYYYTRKNDLQALFAFAVNNKNELWKSRFVGRACKFRYVLLLRENMPAFAAIRFIVFLSAVKAAIFPRFRLDKELNS
jgi:glycosyltransferase involved in cell wall biosynthesis